MRKPLKKKHIPLKQLLLDYLCNRTWFPKFTERHLEEAGIVITQGMIDYWNKNYIGWVKKEGEFTKENAGERMAHMLIQDKFGLGDGIIKSSKGEAPYLLDKGSTHRYVRYENFYLGWNDQLHWMIDEGKNLKDKDWLEDLVEVTIKWRKPK